MFSSFNFCLSNQKIHLIKFTQKTEQAMSEQKVWKEGGRRVWGATEGERKWDWQEAWGGWNKCGVSHLREMETEMEKVGGSETQRKVQWIFSRQDFVSVAQCCFSFFGKTFSLSFIFSTSFFLLPFLPVSHLLCFLSLPCSALSNLLSVSML